MTPDDLARLKALAEAATPGPWHHEVGYEIVHQGDGETGCVGNVSAIADCNRARDRRGNLLDAKQRDANAAFIAACSPSTILALIEAATPVPVPAGERLHCISLIEQAREIVGPFVETDGEGDVDSEGLLESVAQALAASRSEVERLREALTLAITRLGICRDRFDGCDQRHPGEHGLSLLEVPDWIDEGRAALEPTP